MTADLRHRWRTRPDTDRTLARYYICDDCGESGSMADGFGATVDGSGVRSGLCPTRIEALLAHVDRCHAALLGLLALTDDEPDQDPAWAAAHDVMAEVSDER